MGEHLEEGVLNGLVGLGRVAQVLIGNAQGAPLVNGNQARKALPRLVHRAVVDQAADFDREPRVLRLRRPRHGRAATRSRSRSVVLGRGSWGRVSDGSMFTHAGLRPVGRAVYVR